MNLGRIDKFFSDNDIFEIVYCWRESLKIDTEYLLLVLDKPYFVLKASDTVLKAERRLVMMWVCELA